MNRHEKRKAAALSRIKARSLMKFIPEGFKDLEPIKQPLVALNLAYRAWHAGRLTDKQARSVGCTTSRSG